VHRLRIEFSKFLVVGGMNFVFTLILFYIMVKVIEINYVVSLIVVSLLGMIITYSFNYAWVFKTEKKLVFRGRLVNYTLAGLLSISLNALALDYIVKGTGFDPFYVQTALIPLIVFFNFSTAKFWTLKPPRSQ